MKLLYLADLYWAREHEGLTLTGGPWAFVHFGPFAGEALDTIEQASGAGLVRARPYSRTVHRAARWAGRRMMVGPASPARGAPARRC